jgi:hypothetical protein
MSKINELPEPIGKFIIENAEGVPSNKGTVYHYSEVRKLLNLYKKQLELTAVSHQRELLTDYEKFANGDNYIGAKEMIDKQIDDFIEVNCG